MKKWTKKFNLRNKKASSTEIMVVFVEINILICLKRRYRQLSDMINMDFFDFVTLT